MTIDQAIDEAVTHHKAGNLPEAEAAYRRILTESPDNPRAMHLMGLLAYHVRKFDIALDLMQRAIALDPSQAQYFCNLGLVFAAQGRANDAIAAYRHALQLQPDYVQACNNLGVIYFGLRQIEPAIECYRKAIALDPKCVDALNNLGNALLYAGQADQAVQIYRRVLEIRPNWTEGHNNLGGALVAMGQVREGLAAFRRATEIVPEFLEPRVNAAMALLLLGEFEEGWKHYEVRRENPALFRLDIRQRMWKGGDLAGKRILVHSEQGIGDTLQFARYLPLIKSRGATVILECPPPLQPLLKNMEGVDECIARGDRLPAFSVQCPLLSAPFVMGTTLETIPANVPYITADPQLSAQWAQRLADDKNLKVGLVWAGKPDYKNDRNRSMPLDQFAPLMQIPGVSLYSLQKSGAPQQAPGGATIKLKDLTSELNNFADTAALVANLDLVISVDTAVAHLAGAMARPVWTLLPLTPDFRWMLDREDSPWYPTMRLFRQRSFGDWTHPIRGIAQSLAELAAARGPR